jgi:hypothetical protein
MTTTIILEFQVDVIWRKSGRILGDHCIIKFEVVRSVGCNARCVCGCQAEAPRHVNGAMALAGLRGVRTP